MSPKIGYEAVRQVLAQARVGGSAQSPEYTFGVMSALMWVLSARQESPVSKIELQFPPTEREIEAEADLAESYGTERLGQTATRREYCRGVSAALKWAVGRTATPPVRVDLGGGGRRAR